MVITKKHIGVFVAALVALLAAAYVYHNHAAEQTVAGHGFKIILDAGHQA